MLYPHYIHVDDTRLQNLFAEQFPSREGMLYLNHAAISPWPRVTRDAVAAFARENLERGPMQGTQWLAREADLRRRAAGLLNAASGDDIALLQNTSAGICMVANGISWRSGDNIVTPRNEFITNQLPWDALEAQGVEVRRVAVRTTEDPETALLAAMDERTRVLTVSAVAWVDGFRLDLQRLGEACKDHSCLYFVDAIQQFGALPIDVTAAGIDVLAAGSHKWQMGPEGIALFYCSEPWRERLRLSQRGWRMLDQPYRLEYPDREPSATARRFEAGTPNTLGQAALHASLGLLQEIGQDRVEQRILENTDYLLRNLQTMPGIEIISDTRLKRRSGIVNFKPRDGDIATLRRELGKCSIYGAARGNGFRVSPHYYQGPAQLKALLEALHELI